MAQLFSFYVHPSVIPTVALAVVAGREEEDPDYAEERIVNQADEIRVTSAFREAMEEMQAAGKVNEMDLLWFAARIYAAGQESVIISSEMLAHQQRNARAGKISKCGFPNQ